MNSKNCVLDGKVAFDEAVGGGSELSVAELVRPKGRVENVRHLQREKKGKRVGKVSNTHWK